MQHGVMCQKSVVQLPKKCDLQLPKKCDLQQLGSPHSPACLPACCCCCVTPCCWKTSPTEQPTVLYSTVVSAKFRRAHLSRISPFEFCVLDPHNNVLPAPSCQSSVSRKRFAERRSDGPQQRDRETNTSRSLLWVRLELIEQALIGRVKADTPLTLLLQSDACTVAVAVTEIELILGYRINHGTRLL